MKGPLLLKPEFKSRVWGGHRLKTFLGKDIPGTGRIGESWEVFHRPRGSSTIVAPEYGNPDLNSLLEIYGDEILGRDHHGKGNGDRGKRFPLLVKFLDVMTMLSVQVHPGDEYARRNEGDEGKEEAWVVLHAGPGAKAVTGLKPGLSRESLRHILLEEPGKIEDYLEIRPVSKGDVIPIMPGTVHALEGALVYEVQRNSDVTYRLYDWGRVGLDGTPRTLHLEKSLDVIDFRGGKDRGITRFSGNKEKELLLQCKSFRLWGLRLERGIQVETPDSFRVITVVEGSLDAGGLKLEKGETALIPWVTGSIHVSPKNGPSEAFLVGPGLEY